MHARNTYSKLNEINAFKRGGLFQVATTERDIIIRFHIPDLETTSINGELKVDF